LFPTKSIRIWRHCDVMSVICFLYFLEFCPRYFDGLLRADIPSFFTANIASQTSKRHVSACNIWTFSRRFSKNLTLRAPKKYLYLTSLWRHELYLFSVFRWIFPAIFQWFSKKLSTSVVVHQTIFYQPDCMHWVFLLVSMYANCI
jgi:hypothetical protein